MYVGKTKILLHNVHTGRDEKIEHGNVFKAANIQNYMRTLGYYASAFSSDVPLWQLVTGGILLFDSEIPTNSNIIPAGHGMTANGAYNVTNNSTPTELGTWNALESSVSSDGNTITMVYDWDTSHGNGEIGSVCLTSYEAGVKGIGNARGEYVNKSTSTRAATKYQTDYMCFGDMRISISPNITDNKLTITCNKVWGETALLANTSYDVEITLANQLGRIWNSALVQTSQYKFLVIRCIDNSSGDFPNGATIYIDEIDIRNMSATARNIVNTSGKTLGGGYYFNMGLLGISENEIMVCNRSDNTGHFIVNLSNGTFTQFGEGTKAAYDYAPGDIINDNLIIVSPSWFTDTAGARVYDRLTGTVRKQNAANPKYRFGGHYIESIGAMLTGDGSMQNNPYYLATINNLETSVTKDVSKTMKVIYTLQKAS